MDRIVNRPALLVLVACIFPAACSEDRLRPGDIDALPSRPADARSAYGSDPLQFGELRLPDVCMAAPTHPLHQLGRELTFEDLRKHRHIVIRDSGEQRVRAAGWLNELRLTVSNKATSIHAVATGMGCAWYPDDAVRGELERGALKPLPLREGAEKSGTIYLIFADREAAGPGTLRLAQIIREGVERECKAGNA